MKGIGPEGLMINRPILTGSLRARDVQAYTLCEHLTEGLVYSMIVFSPWAFGTTQRWSIWTMNAAGYLLGALLGIKLIIRHGKGYHSPRWDENAMAKSEDNSVSHNEDSGPKSPVKAVPRFPTAFCLSKLLVILTVLIVGYCIVSAVNAAAVYDPDAFSFRYRPHLTWLPHSFDRARTWFAAWNYLALACTFWAVADWLPGKSEREQRPGRHTTSGAARWGTFFPARLRRLLWVLCINGALVGLEAIIQRLEGSGRLLFLIKPVINPDALSQFGPYHYRANAAAYFNLIWPVCLGFWWTLQREPYSRTKRHHVLLVSGILMAACPIISTSRGGALVTAAILVLALFLLVSSHFLLAAHRHYDPRKRQATFALLLLFFTGTLALGLALGWKALKPRMADIQEGFGAREEMFDTAKPMARDYPLFGTGPGTFETVFQLYRASTDTYWPAQLHNDWLETRITFGWLGSWLITMAFAVVLLRWFAPGGIHGGRRFILLTWLALGGALVHARFDFPFQIDSLLFLFLVLCAILFNLSRRPEGS